MRKEIDFLSRVFLFNGLEHDRIENLISPSDLDIRSFNRLEVIYSPQEYEKKVGFVISGQCEVRRSSLEDGGAVINTLNKYDCFGVLTIFSANEFPTYIYAKKTTEILFLSKSTVDSIIEKNSIIARNVIIFLANRIAFLNSRVNTFSGSTVESRLASYLVALSERCGSLTFSINCQKCSAAINAGRASVYRGISSLSERGLITFDSKKIIISDLKGLERISK